MNNDYILNITKIHHTTYVSYVPNVVKSLRAQRNNNRELEILLTLIGGWAQSSKTM
jgi:hypothetical protein